MINGPQPASPRRRHHLYLYDDGFVISCPTVVSETTRFNASLLLSLGGAPFELSAGGASCHTSAAIVRPLQTRQLMAVDLRLLSIGLSPNHRDFRWFTELPEPGFLPVDLALFDEHAEDMEALYRGDLAGTRARELTDQIIATMAAQLPAPLPLDPRVSHAVYRLDRDPSVPLDKLADEVGLSYDRMSHLFSESMGLPMRSYVLSLKIHNAARLMQSGMRITDIAHAAGFSDSSHIARVWTKAFGGAPSNFFGNEQMKVVATFGRRVRAPEIG